MTERVSVAMCTYQGERFVGRQLETIAAQSRPPDELVICDDCSTDGTVGILRSFRPDSIPSVRVFVNEQNLGSPKNFEKALRLCRGDILFFSDQDDLWHAEKLSRMVEKLKATPGAGAVICDAAVVDEDLRPLGHTMWESKPIRFTPDRQELFTGGRAVAVMLERAVTAGMTLAFRARYLDLILPFPPDWGHDEWTGLVMGAVAEIAMVPEALVDYRQHPLQQTGVLRKSLMRQIAEKLQDERLEYRWLAERYSRPYERLLDKAGDFPPSEASLEAIRGKVAHQLVRAQMRQDGGRFRLTIQEALAGNYRRYSSGWRSIAKDMLMPRMGKAPQARHRVAEGIEPNES